MTASKDQPVTLPAPGTSHPPGAVPGEVFASCGVQDVNDWRPTEQALTGLIEVNQPDLGRC
ncbi:hypothetical protein GCM10010430_78300 [Kitasatospora cystarginea]|uniref:Uncharacterized protein n=1 Tax=Kitasatospora cystarginea TaxID=58350 RepID=A0ABN3F2W3_9ACTN